MKTAEELGLTETEYCSIIKVLSAIQKGEIKDSAFDMSTTGSCTIEMAPACGSPACICGWARHIAGECLFINMAGYQQGLQSLFIMGIVDRDTARVSTSRAHSWKEVTTAQAGRAIQNYLKTGRPQWSEALR